MWTYIGLWILLAIAVGVWAGNRGRGSGTWCLLAILISPLLAAIFLAVSTNLALQAQIAASQPSGATHKRCSACAEWVLPQASVCKHCGAQLTPDLQFEARAKEARIAKARTEVRDTAFGIAALCALGLFVYLFSR